MGFRGDLEFGRQYERLWAEQLKGDVEFAPSGVFKDWDVRTDEASYEVKADRLVCKYGNFFIEHECSGKPSGIMTTKADYWILYDVQDNMARACYKVPTVTLQKLAVTKSIKAGGTSHNTKGYIVPASCLLDYKVLC
jgi:hypothetical protein